MPPTDPLEQYFLDHVNYIFMNERRETDEVFFNQGPILKHNLPVEILGDPPPPKGDPVFELKQLPDCNAPDTPASGRYSWWDLDWAHRSILVFSAHFLLTRAHPGATSW